MSETPNSEISSLIEYAKSLSLKGELDFGYDWFNWDLGNISLHIVIDILETTVEYYRANHKMPVGHFHVDNDEVRNLIQEINDKDKIIMVTASPLGYSFRLIDKTAKRKKSWFLVRRYYSNT